MCCHLWSRFNFAFARHEELLLSEWTRMHRFFVWNSGFFCSYRLLVQVFVDLRRREPTYWVAVICYAGTKIRASFSLAAGDVRLIVLIKIFGLVSEFLRALVVRRIQRNHDNSFPFRFVFCCSFLFWGLKFLFQALEIESVLLQRWNIIYSKLGRGESGHSGGVRLTWWRVRDNVAEASLKLFYL